MSTGYMPRLLNGDTFVHPTKPWPFVGQVVAGKVGNGGATTSKAVCFTIFQTEAFLFCAQTDGARTDDTGGSTSAKG
jgi:hypothetical protein